jgi:predicted Zn-dependent protease
MRTLLTVAVAALLAAMPTGPAVAQADDHAEALTRASCQAAKHSQAVTTATATLEHDPEELGPRLRLADVLVDQGCYQEAVTILEAGSQSHPHNNELAGKLRNVRSLVTEQTYIDGLTSAAEGAKFQRNQLRCLRLADVDACDDALKFKPDDTPLLVAKGDALMQVNQPVDAVAAYKHAVEVKPADEALKTKLAAAEALQASAASAAKAASGPATVADTTAHSTATRLASQGSASERSATSKRAAATTAVASAGHRASQRTGTSALSPVTRGAAATTATSVASMASLEPQTSKTYSNDAPPGQSN